MTSVDSAVGYARKNQEKFLEELFDLLRIPSISTLPENEGDMLETAQWIASQLNQFEFDEVEIIPTPRHPVVYGSWEKVNIYSLF